MDEEKVKEQVYEFQRDVLLVKNKGLTLGAMKFTLDESKKPKEMNFLLGSLGANPAIYELNGDRLKICMDKPGGERPKEFKTKVDSAQKMFTFNRSKQ
jgi:uncharacterized protein (TIGR03067 family)